ncbi:CocE/NonD family hydrolase [Kitasatospora sp. NPDC093806]|uniref:CocE/NonD family hydrolase n=1 Tax=Kitasatospora sp. NPDC093806 TaxID=3155075 RepID=UPI00343A1E36
MVVLLAVLAALGTVLGLVLAPAAGAADAAGPGRGPVLPRLQSLYVPMPDGVRLAVDVWLPPGTRAGAKLPTVLQTERYWRSRAHPGGPENDPRYGSATAWNERGYAYVLADLRGTGASFGTLRGELAADLIADSGTLSDWIAARPWSNGRVGTTGVSYGGDTAMLALGLRNHHITAALPISYDFDPYEDLVRPGGILIEPRLAPYALLLRILDRAAGTTCASSEETRRLCAETGLTDAEPKPVDGPDGAALLAAARAEHAGNANLVDQGRDGVHRDFADGPRSWASGAVGEQAAAISAGGVPVLTETGWLDAGTANGVLSQFTGLTNTQDDWIGPWSHGRHHLADPFLPSRPLDAEERRQLAERAFAFFDRYVKHPGHPDGTRRLHYYTFNEGTWRTTTQWPVPGTRTRRLHLGPDHTLGARPSAVAAADRLDPTADPAAGTGPLDRWNTNLSGDPVSYPDRAAADRALLAYTGEPVTRDTRVTGLGRVTLDVTGLPGTGLPGSGLPGSADGAIHAYLEHVAPDGRVTYLTEGQLALADRATTPTTPDWRRLRTPRSYTAAAATPFPSDTPQRVTIDLLPTSALLRPGDRIRLTLATANPDSFEPRPATGTAAYLITHGGLRGSYLDLPVVE